MMVHMGNFLFHWRNLLFPSLFISIFLTPWVVTADPKAELLMNIAGWATAIAGQAIRAATIGLAYIRRGGKNRRVYAEDLVTEGIFAHSRNPLYLGNLLIVLGAGLVANSLFFILAGLPFFLFAYLAIIMAEEDYLGRKFGRPYQEYCRDVPRLIPRLSGIGRTFAGMSFNWRRVMLKDYGTAFEWITGLALLDMKDGYLTFGHLIQEGRNPSLILLVGIAAIFFLTARILKKTRLVRAG